MNYFWAVLLQIVLIFLNAVCASAEIAVISMNKTKLSILEAKGGKSAKKAKKLAKLTSDPARFLSTIQVAITLAGFLGSAFAADMFAEPLVIAIVNTGVNIPASVISAVCVVLITLILAFFNIVFGELIPKRIAMHSAEKVATGLTGVLSVVSIIFRPIVFLLSVSTNCVLKILGIPTKDSGDDVTEADIIMMAEVGRQSGSIEKSENQFIKNIFEFSDLTVGEICTHRKDVDVVFERESDDEWREKIYSTAHTFYPVCGKDTDDVKGVLSTKRYFRLKDQSRASVKKDAIQPPVFVYEGIAANKLFDKMKKTHEYFSVVLDEYGGMKGIITIHDLLEVLVGDLDEKGEEAEYSITALGDDEWEINGLAPFNKVEDALGITVKTDDGVEYETFSGYVLGLLVELPKDGSTFKLDTERLEINVLCVDKQRVTKIRVKLKPRQEE